MVKFAIYASLHLKRRANDFVDFIGLWLYDVDTLFRFGEKL